MTAPAPLAAEGARRSQGGERRARPARSSARPGAMSRAASRPSMMVSPVSDRCCRQARSRIGPQAGGAPRSAGANRWYFAAGPRARRRSGRRPIRAGEIGPRARRQTLAPRGVEQRHGGLQRPKPMVALVARAIDDLRFPARPGLVTSATSPSDRRSRRGARPPLAGRSTATGAERGGARATVTLWRRWRRPHGH